MSKRKAARAARENIREQLKDGGSLITTTQPPIKPLKLAKPPVKPVTEAQPAVKPATLARLKLQLHRVSVF